jgi:NitT/TauT family transport system permease protein
MADTGVAGSPGERRAALSARWRTALDRCVLGLLLLAIWQGANWFGGAYWFSSPAATATRFVTLLTSGDLGRNALYTLQNAGLGYVIGGVPGMVLPFLLRRAPFIRATLDPFMVGGYGVPKLALAPLFILWFGIGAASKIALVASVVLFIVYFSTAAGIRAIDPRLLRMAELVDASPYHLARHIVLPAAVPYIFAGFKTAAPYAISASVVAELISSNRGLGYLIQTGATNFDTAQIFASIAATAIIVIAATAVMDALERHALRWRPATASDSSTAMGG